MWKWASSGYYSFLKKIKFIHGGYPSDTLRVSQQKVFEILTWLPVYTAKNPAKF
jgi:hypothetical protein